MAKDMRENSCKKRIRVVGFNDSETSNWKKWGLLVY